MCTLSWWRNGEAYEVFFNRDELKTRLPASPPKLQTREGVQYLAPSDGDFGGTWLWVNQYGLTVCILNRYTDVFVDADKPAEEYISRGLLVSSLTTARNLESVKTFLENEKLENYRPFTLVIFESGRSVCKFSWNGCELSFDKEIDDTTPITSCLYDPVEAEHFRVSQFKKMLKEEKEITSDFLLKFHHFYLQEKGTHSVCMQREDGETESLSRVFVSPEKISFRYALKVPGEARFEPMSERTLSPVSSCSMESLHA